MTTATLTARDYQSAYRKEADRVYSQVDAFEARMGFALETDRLRQAAKVLACPVKVNPPNWQHGRVLYAAARRYLDGRTGKVMLLDIGTAKGFSALCLQWAMSDAKVQGNVVSVDVLDPIERVRRNTVVELDGLKTLTEILGPWPEASHITFLCSTGIDYLRKYAGRIEVAFVDGKHRAEVVWKEALMLADRQVSGDLVIFDDVHIPDVRSAVSSLSMYQVEWMSILPNRAYAIGRRK